MLALCFSLLVFLTPPPPPQALIKATLDDFHDAASKADGPRYFGHFTDAGVFVGTDPGERWTVAEFKAYAEPHFSKGKGWTYVPFERHIDLGPQRKTAWFYERLRNPRFGEARGSGVLVLEGGRWRIAQYVLSFPIPNARTEAVMEILKAP